MTSHDGRHRAGTSVASRRALRGKFQAAIAADWRPGLSAARGRGRDGAQAPPHPADDDGPLPLGYRTS